MSNNYIEKATDEIVSQSSDRLTLHYFKVPSAKSIYYRLHA